MARACVLEIERETERERQKGRETDRKIDRVRKVWGGMLRATARHKRRSEQTATATRRRFHEVLVALQRALRP